MGALGWPCLGSTPEQSRSFRPQRPGEREGPRREQASCGVPQASSGERKDALFASVAPPREPRSSKQRTLETSVTCPGGSETPEPVASWRCRIAPAREPAVCGPGCLRARALTLKGDSPSLSIAARPAGLWLPRSSARAAGVRVPARRPERARPKSEQPGRGREAPPSCAPRGDLAIILAGSKGGH